MKAFDVDQVWHLDLMEFTEVFARSNKDIKYCLVCIDVFSKFVWTHIMKHKSAEEFVNVLSIIFQKNKPSIIYVDGEKGFWSNQNQQLMRSHNIDCLLATKVHGACVAERVIRSLKEIMF